MSQAQTRTETDDGGGRREGGGGVGTGGGAGGGGREGGGREGGGAAGAYEAAAAARAIAESVGKEEGVEEYVFPSVSSEGALGGGEGYGVTYVGETGEVGGVVVRQGRGVYVDGKTEYAGEWEGDGMHGYGVMRFASGAVYAGTFVDNAFDGPGVYSWPSGAEYAGVWRGGVMHGKDGVYRDADGFEWFGEFYGGRGPGLARRFLP